MKLKSKIKLHWKWICLSTEEFKSHSENPFHGEVFSQFQFWFVLCGSFYLLILASHMQMNLPTLELGSTCSPHLLIQCCSQAAEGKLQTLSGAFLGEMGSLALGQCEVRSWQVCAVLPLVEEPVSASLANLCLVFLCGWDWVFLPLTDERQSETCE